MTIEKNAKGITFMILSMASLASTDTLIKVAASFMTPAQALLYLMAGALVLFVLIAKMQGEILLDPKALAPVLMFRYLAEITGMVGMVMALTYVPLSTVGAITQATPILVAVGAVLFLGEKVNWRRWSSIAVGFVGVILIVQPGASGFDYAVLWAVLAMLALSIRDLTIRLIPSDMASTCLAAYTMVPAVPFSLAWVFYNGDPIIPPDINWFIVIPMVSLGALGYMLLIASMRMAAVSVVTPFRYARILFLLVLALVVFDERPGALMLIGASMIIGSGLYMLWREQRVKSKST